MTNETIRRLWLRTTVAICDTYSRCVRDTYLRNKKKNKKKKEQETKFVENE